MENEVLKLILSVEDKSVIKATQEAKRLEKEIKALVATEKVLGKEHEIVKQKTIEIKRKLQDYANISSQKAVPTLKKLIQSERTLSLEVDKNTAALTRNTKATKLAADASNQYGTYSIAAGKKLNTFNMRVQQTGYQLQDFFVQLQSGTSFFTAFGQQGSQLAGIFGPAGAVFGAVIAIGSAIAAIGYNALTASEEVKEFGEEFGEAKTYLDAFKDSLDLLAQENGELEETFGNYTSYIRNLEEAALSASESLSRIELGESVSALSKKLDDGLLNGFTPLGKLLFGEKGGALKDLGLQESGLTERDILNLKVNVETGAFEDAAQQVEFILDKINKSQSDLTAEGLKYQLSYIELGKELAKHLALTNGTAQAAKDAAEDDKNRIKDLAAAELKLWKENNEYIEEQKRLDAEGDLAILNSRAQAERDLISANSKYEREQDALRKKELDETNKKVTELAERLSIPFSAALSLIRQAKAEATVGLDAFGGAGDFKYNVPTKFSPPKKVRGAKAPKDPLQELMKNLMLQKRLFGVEEDRASVMKALGESYSKYTPKQIDSAIELTESIRKQNEALKDQQDELDRIDDQAKQLAAPFDDFFMALVDGTTSAKDAFRSMATDIIQQLYRILVVQELVGSISGAIQGYMAGPVQGPNLPVDSLDGGGYTGSGPRSGGLDGKGGFMAMLHPRETVVDHTKGQSAGGTVVNQVFNISANTSDDTKRLITQTIAQASPAIINQSVGAVMNQRRRGGAMKSAFG